MNPEAKEAYAYAAARPDMLEMLARITARDLVQQMPYSKTPADLIAGRKVLAKAIARAIKAGCQPVCIPVPEAASRALGGPQSLPAGFVTALAVGIDVDGQVTCVTQSAWAPDRAAAHEAARCASLGSLACLCARSGL
ncbi:MAG: hypothetical protein ACKO2N_09400 [Tabrizicola sp.]